MSVALNTDKMTLYMTASKSSQKLEDNDDELYREYLDETM